MQKCPVTKPEMELTVKLYLLTLILLTLNACSPHSENNIAPQDMPVRQFQVVDGPSGKVAFEIEPSADGELGVPSQVSIHIEKIDPKASHIQIKNLPPENKMFLGSKSQEIIRLGCDQSVTEEFAADIVEADVIEFCGEISLPLKPLFFKANKIIFNRSKLSTELNGLTRQDLVKVKMARFTFQAKSILLVGDNSLTLQGGASEGFRNTAPRVSFHTGGFSDTGSIDIYSMKSFNTVEQ